MKESPLRRAFVKTVAEPVSPGAASRMRVTFLTSPRKSLRIVAIVAALEPGEEDRARQVRARGGHTACARSLCQWVGSSNAHANHLFAHSLWGY